MPIARSLIDFNISNYTNVASRCFDNGINTIYIIAWGINIPWAKSTVKAIEDLGKFAKHGEYTFPIVLNQDRFETYLAVLMNAS